MDSRAYLVVALAGIFSAGCYGSSEVQLIGPDSVSVEHNTAIRLACRVSTAVTQVTWKRGADTIVADTTKKITIAFNKTDESATHDSVLTIAEAEKSNSGNYSCAVDSTHSKIVHVTVTESHITLSATKKRVQLVPGSPLMLSCNADIHTSVVWYKGSTVIKPGDDVTISEEVSPINNHLKTSKLTYGSATASHAGVYVCQDDHHHDHDDHEHHEHHDDDGHEHHDEHHYDHERQEIIVSQSSDVSGQSSSSEMSAMLFASVLVLALLR